MGLPTPTRCVPSVTMKSLMLHFFAFGWNCFGIYYDRFVYILPKYNEYGGRFQYLTSIISYFCLIAFGYAFVLDLIQFMFGYFEDKKITKDGYKNHNSLLISIRDDMLTYWVFTSSTFLVLMYWSLIAIDPESIHPKEENKYVPLFGWFNQYMHTCPLIVIFILIVNINYEYSTFFKSIFYTLTFGCSYMTWISHLAKVNGRWVYPFIEWFTTEEYILFCILCHVVFYIIYFIGRKISSIIWNETYKEKVIIQFEQKGL